MHKVSARHRTKQSGPTDTKEVRPEIQHGGWKMTFHPAFCVARSANQPSGQAKLTQKSQVRAPIEALAIRSSSSASDTAPETAYGSSSGFSEYFSRMAALILPTLT